MSWTINGTSMADLRAAKLVSAQLVLRSRAADTLTLVFDLRIDAALPSGFAVGDEVVAVQATITRFRGRVVHQKRLAPNGAQGEMIEVEVAGPWWYLDNIVYQQEYRYSVAHSYRRRPGYRLFASKDGVLIPTHTQLADAIAYAVTCGAPLQMGANPTGPQPPYSDGANFTCAEVLQRCLRWTPDACTWFDYTTTPPTLNIVPWSVVSSTPTTVALTDATLMGANAIPRPELLVPGVRLLFENALGTDPFEPYPIEQVYPAEFTGLAAQAVHLVLDLRGQIYPPTGLAQRYYDALSTLQHSGELVFEGAAETVLSWRPARAVQITGGLAAWSTMRAQVQVVQHDLVAFTTRVEFGPPEHLSVQDLVELLLADSRDGVPYSLSTGKPAEIDYAGDGPPFTIFDASDEAGAKISIVLGLVNNLIPTLNGTALTADPRPTSLVLGNGTWSITVRVTTDSGGIGISAAIIGSSTGTPEDTNTQGHLLLGEVVVADGEITELRQFRTGNHFHARCGTSAPYEHQWGT